jgi:2-methylcitrate dehydratase PrpD
MSSDSDARWLTDGLGTRWATAETSFKFHASCRHTHPAADALQTLMKQNQLKADDIVKVTAHVHQGAIDVLGPVTDPQTIHQSKFSMGFVLAMIATLGRAALADFTEKSLKNNEIRSFHDRVTMVLDPEVDGAYPRRWLGRVSVQTQDGRTLECRVDTPKGDPDNTLSRQELEDKAQRLVSFSGAATPDEVSQSIRRIWNLRNEAGVRDFLADR